MSVKVAVRVRPFNDREAGSQCCVRMVGNQTVIIDPATQQERPFTFDYSFWSHDGFRTDQNGLMIKTAPHYSDQDDVYKALGQQVLNNAWEGYNCCLFAYGQTGAGKSYSMIGYGQNIGIVPIACNEIFTRIKKLSSESKRFEVNFSMLEIYNEKVQDLLIDPEQRPLGGLKVREHKTLGVYVQDLSKHPVDSYQAIDEKMEEGQRNRTIGATQMNATSSRAHTVITIEFKQIDIASNGVPQEKFSVINLVDLAGSEKSGATGATGDRLKEGAQINLSLTCLGRCIMVLADKAKGSKTKEVVPFRDSSLTRILQNALGGNSKTIMICAISPAFLNYEETLSTLRYADSAKKIKNNAVINESVQDKLIRELKEENAELKARLLKLSKAAAAGGGTVNLAELGMGDMAELMEDMESNERLVADFQKPWAEKLAEAKEKKANELSEDRNDRQSFAKAEEVAKTEESKSKDITPEKQEVKEENPLDMLATESPSESLRRSVTRNREGSFRRASRTLIESKDKTVPHLMNLHEDPQLSGIIYYSLSSGQITIGRKGKTGEPSPEIILGAIGMQQNHAKINLLPNGLFELTCIDSDAAAVTMVNGKYVSGKKRSKVLNHLDRICFAGSAIFVFHYPLLAQSIQQSVEANASENEGVDLKLQLEQAWVNMQDTGIPSFELGTSSTACPNYNGNFADMQAVNWDMAFQEVEDGENAKNSKSKVEKEKQDKKALLAKDQEIKKQKEDFENEKKATEARLKEEYDRNIQVAKEVQEGQIALQQRRLKEQQEALLAEDNIIKEKAWQLQQQLEQTQRELRQKEEQHRKELADQQKKFQNEEKIQEANLEKKKLMSQIKADIDPDIILANEIAQNLQKNITFSVMFTAVNKDEGSQFGEQVGDYLQQRKEKLEIKVEDFDNNMILIWTPERFREKFVQMREVWEQYGDRGLTPQQEQHVFPTKDEQEAILIGESYYKLEGLAMLMDNPVEVNLIGSSYAVQGKIEVNLIPTDPTGTDEPPEELITDNPEDLIDNRLDFLVQITRCKDLPEDLCRDVYVEYTFYLDPEKHRTVVIKGKNRNPEFNYSKHHTVENVTDMLVEYLKKECIFFKVYGFADVKPKQQKANEPQQIANKFNQQNTSNNKSVDSSVDSSSSKKRNNTVNISNDSTRSDVSDNYIVVQEKQQPIKKQKPEASTPSNQAKTANNMNQAQIRRASVQNVQPPTPKGKEDDKNCSIF